MMVEGNWFRVSLDFLLSEVSSFSKILCASVGNTMLCIFRALYIIGRTRLYLEMCGSDWANIHLRIDQNEEEKTYGRMRSISSCRRKRYNERGKWATTMKWTHNYNEKLKSNPSSPVRGRKKKRWIGNYSLCLLFCRKEWMRKTLTFTDNILRWLWTWMIECLYYKSEGKSIMWSVNRQWIEKVMVVREWKRIRTHLTSKLALCRFSCHFNFLSSTADHDHRILLCISIDLLLLRRTNVVGGRSFDGCGRESFAGY